MLAELWDPSGRARLLVGPDNGLLSLAWEPCGGVEAAVDVSRSPHRLEPVSATFHGRDIFAPVAAHLARGAALEDAGPLRAVITSSVSALIRSSSTATPRG